MELKIVIIIIIIIIIMPERQNFCSINVNIFIVSFKNFSIKILMLQLLPGGFGWINRAFTVFHLTTC